jgi:dihydroflavonol-4-reductase
MITGSETASGVPGRILITGAGGFIGSTIADMLCSRGYSVRALIRKTGNRALLPQPAEIAIGDVTQPETLKSALAGVDGVIHCAGTTKAFALEEYLRVNRDGTRNLLGSCAGMDCRPRVVCLGSLASFGTSIDDRPTLEEDKPRPVSHYGISKLEGHRVTEEFMQVLSLTNLIPPAVYGPRDRDLLAYFRLAKSGVIPFVGTRSRRFSAVHVRDVADAAIACLIRPESAGRSYFVSDGEVHTWEEFADAICAAMRKKPLRVTIPSWAARAIAFGGDCVSYIQRRPPLLGSQKMHELLQPAWVCSSERIRRELGFSPSYPLREGILDTYRWYLAHGWL